MYSAKKEVKEYLDYYVKPDEKAKAQEYKNIIQEEFYPKRGFAKTRFSVCRKAITDFKKLKPSPEVLADVMMFYMESACRFTHDFGDMWEQFYDVIENNFDKTLQYIADNGLWGGFECRIQRCIGQVEDCGWGFPDTLWDFYYERKPK